jgi:hypothetical protein
MDTDSLIHRIAANATPVRPLTAPWRRTGLWLAMALNVAVLAAVAGSIGRWVLHWPSPAVIFQRSTSG